MKQIVIDSNCLCYRAWYTTGGLSHDGNDTGIIFGFLNQILHLSQMFESSDFVFAWDSKKSLRKRIYPGYKGKRHAKKTPEEREERKLAYSQFDLLRTNVLPNIGFTNNIHKTGYEADDIIAKVVMNPDKQYLLVSTDEDFYQLLGYCNMYNPNKRKTMTRRTFQKEYGIPSWKWSWVKAYAGCNSDNVEGIRGVGEKTAIKYILNELKCNSVKYKSIVSKEGQNIYNRNMKLVRLPFSGTGEIELKENKLDIKVFEELCQQYDFNSFLRNIKDWKELFDRRD